MEFKSLKKGGTTILSISWRVPRIIIPAASAVRDDLLGRMYDGHGVVGVEFLDKPSGKAEAYSFAEKQREKIYVLDSGKSLMLPLSQDLSQI